MTALSTAEDVRQAYSADVSGLVMHPDAVARPTSADEVCEVLRQASADKTPVTAAGNQTSTTGASITDRGVLLSMRAMDRIIDVDAAKGTAVVEPGVLLGDLNRTAAPHALHFAPDPTSMDDVTVGGAIACNASGARSLLYGTTRAHVRALHVAMANGATIEVRRSGLERIERVVEATLRHVVAMGGTVSAEHGIGKIKRRWLPLQASPTQIAVMRAVKRELDPDGLLAPGNIL